MRSGLFISPRSCMGSQLCVATELLFHAQSLDGSPRRRRRPAALTGTPNSYPLSDKGGAAAICGLMLAASRLKPKNVKIVAKLAMVRNSIGADAYVADEVWL